MMTHGTTGAQRTDSDVRALYSRSRWWLTKEGEVRRGGCYVLRLCDFSWECGEGETLEDALVDLGDSLRYWLEHFDDYEPPEDYPEEPPAIQTIRETVRRGELLEWLRAGLREPVLDPLDEPR